jgi:hypothetical protein
MTTIAEQESVLNKLRERRSVLGGTGGSNSENRQDKESWRGRGPVDSGATGGFDRAEDALTPAKTREQTRRLWDETKPGQDEARGGATGRQGGKCSSWALLQGNQATKYNQASWGRQGSNDKRGTDRCQCPRDERDETGNRRAGANNSEASNRMPPARCQSESVKTPTRWTIRRRRLQRVAWIQKPTSRSKDVADH